MWPYWNLKILLRRDSRKFVLPALGEDCQQLGNDLVALLILNLCDLSVLETYLQAVCQYSPNDASEDLLTIDSNKGAIDFRQT